LYYHSIISRVVYAVIIQFDLLKMSKALLETVEDYNVTNVYCYITKELCIKLVIETSL